MATATALIPWQRMSPRTPSSSSSSSGVRNPNSPRLLLWNPRPTPRFSAQAIVPYASEGHHSRSLYYRFAEAFSRQSLLLLHIASTSAFFLFGFPAHASHVKPHPPTVAVATENHIVEGPDMAAERVDDVGLQTAFQNFKSKTYALSVPLRIIALRGSIPPSWIKDFIQSQGRRLRLTCEFRGTLDSIFSDMLSAVKKGSLEPKSSMAADIVSIGDSWLSYAITQRLIVPIRHAEQQHWFKCLSQRWKDNQKVILFAKNFISAIYWQDGKRNAEGEVDSMGDMWGVPYRWGSMVIAYKKNKFKENNLTAIEDWGDIWRPELAGKISMVDSPREVIGAVLKYMGASYNTTDLDGEITGGRKAVLHNLMLLQGQVRLFDSVHYIKAFGAGDVWVAVGWSSDIIPAAKRMTNVAVVVPKSGASLWADLWAIPAATRFSTARVGGRVKGPSPLIHQWLEFCLQMARGLPFQQETIPGASPSALDHLPEVSQTGSTIRKPKLETNLVDGIPPPEILARCEFLEPLPKKTMEVYEWLLFNMLQRSSGSIRRLLDHLSALATKNRFGTPSR